MGLFDKMFGSGAAAAQAESKLGDPNQRFDELKNKYRTVLNFIDQKGVRLQNLHVENDKLFIRGVAPSEDVKNEVWEQIKLVDAEAGDLTADFSVEEQSQQKGVRTYTVKGGDSLWKIAKNHYGDGNEYMKVFYANRDKLESPDSVIHPGDVLNVPEE